MVTSHKLNVQNIICIFFHYYILSGSSLCISPFIYMYILRLRILILIQVLFIIWYQAKIRIRFSLLP
jgi:hypothetical protein